MFKANSIFLLLLSGFFLISSSLVRPAEDNPFYEAVKSLESEGFFIKPISNCFNNNDETKICNTNPDKYWLNFRMNVCKGNPDHSQIQAPFDQINEIHTLMIEAGEDLTEGIKPAFKVTRWLYPSPEYAENAYNSLEQLSAELTECIFSGPHSWWQVDDKVFLFRSPAIAFQPFFDDLLPQLKHSLAE